MDKRFDLAWDSFPTDGACAPVSVNPLTDPGEHDELFRAWCRERHESIELKLYLEEAVRLLKHFCAQGGGSLEGRRRAKMLLGAIRNSKSDSSDLTG